MSRRKRAKRAAAPSLKRRPPPNPAPRRVKLSKPTKEGDIAKLREHAYLLIDFPELLDDPEWKQKALVIIQTFIAQNRQRRLGPRGIAALVDESIDYKIKQGVPLADAVEAARDVYADLLDKGRGAVRQAHLRYGKRATTKAR